MRTDASSVTCYDRNGVPALTCTGTFLDGEGTLWTIDCGVAAVQPHTPGDINGDGIVNNKDATRLFQYLSHWDVEIY